MRVALGHDCLMATSGSVASFYFVRGDAVRGSLGHHLRPRSLRATGWGATRKWSGTPWRATIPSSTPTAPRTPRSPASTKRSPSLIRRFGKTHSIVGRRRLLRLRGAVVPARDGAVPAGHADQQGLRARAHRHGRGVPPRRGSEARPHGLRHPHRGRRCRARRTACSSRPSSGGSSSSRATGGFSARTNGRIPRLRIAVHICGYIEPIIDDLVEVGVDVLNPVQPLAMDPARLKKRFGKRLSFWGAVDDQKVMPFGSPADVEAEVRLRIAQLAPGGGYILCPSHNMQPTTPIGERPGVLPGGREIPGLPLESRSGAGSTEAHGAKYRLLRQAGQANTAETLRLARERAGELGVRHVLVASTHGGTALQAADAFRGAASR